MKLLGLFGAGFAAGWVVRGSVDSSRGAVVGAIAAAYGAVDRVRRFVAIERENIEDLFAEAKARHLASLEREAAAAAPRSDAYGPASARRGHEYVQ